MNGTTQQQVPTSGNSGYTSHTFIQPAVPPPAMTVLPNLSHTYTLAGSGPRMATGFPSNFDLNFKHGRASNHNTAWMNAPRLHTNDPVSLHAGHAYHPNSGVTNVTASTQNFSHRFNVASSVQEGGTRPSLLSLGIHDIPHCYN